MKELKQTNKYKGSLSMSKLKELFDSIMDAPEPTMIAYFDKKGIRREVTIKDMKPNELFDNMLGVTKRNTK